MHQNVEAHIVATPQGPIVDRRKECALCSKLDDRLKAVEGAFPDGPEKHRGYHQAKIDAASDEAEFWKAAKMELTKVGVASVVGVIKTILILAGLGLLYKFGLGGLVAGTIVPK